MHPELNSENKFVVLVVSVDPGGCAQQEKRILDEVGQRIAKARKEKAISQEQLAAETGLDRVAIGYIEQGRRRPTVTTIIKLAKGLDLKLEQLFKGL